MVKLGISRPDSRPGSRGHARVNNAPYRPGFGPGPRPGLEPMPVSKPGPTPFPGTGPGPGPSPGPGLSPGVLFETDAGLVAVFKWAMQTLRVHANTRVHLQPLPAGMLMFSTLMIRVYIYIYTYMNCVRKRRSSDTELVQSWCL